MLVGLTILCHSFKFVTNTLAHLTEDYKFIRGQMQFGKTQCVRRVAPPFGAEKSLTGSQEVTHAG
eukprot:2692845-Amphidinium_carterae.1